MAEGLRRPEPDGVPACSVSPESESSAVADADAVWRQKQTYFYERWRAGTVGLAEAFGSTFFLMLAIKHYSAGDTIQTFIAAGSSMGLLLGPLFVAVVKSTGYRTPMALAVCHAVAALFLLAAAVWPTLGFYMAGGIGAMVFLMASIPLATQFYQQNYRPEVRGRLFSIASTIRVGSAAVFTWWMGEMLAWAWIGPRTLVACTAVALALSAWLLSRCPGRPLENKGTRVPFAAINLIWKDRAFGWLIVVWMFMGLGNLMMVPLRVKFLVEPRYGFGYNEATTALLLGVIPAVTVFLFTWWWGRLFDRMNFFLLRAILNAVFLLSNLCFFLIGEMWGFVLGCFLIGMAFSGGNVAWSLWVTKLSAPEKVADYMSVHTFCTGLRGVLAPLFAIPLAAIWPMEWLVAISTGFIVISILLLGPELVTIRRRRPGHRLTDQTPE